MNLDPAAALVALQARLGGALQRPGPDAWHSYGSNAIYYQDKYGAMQWLDTRVQGLRAVVLGALRRRVGPFGVDDPSDESSELRVQQAVALVLPGAAVDSLLAPVSSPRGTFPHLFLLDHPLPPFTWTPAGREPGPISAGPFRLAGCFQGVLYAVQDGPELDPAAAEAALHELARLAALPWRAPSADAVAAFQAREVQQQKAGVRVLVVSLAVLAALATVLAITLT